MRLSKTHKTCYITLRVWRKHSVYFEIQRSVQANVVTSYAARTIPPKSNDDSPWLSNLRRLLKEIAPTSHEISSILILLSSAVTGGTALPPYLLAPKFYNISQRLDALDPGMFSMRGH